jgi:hypothetical protein
MSDAQGVYQSVDSAALPNAPRLCGDGPYDRPGHGRKEQTAKGENELPVFRCHRFFIPLAAAFALRVSRPFFAIAFRCSSDIAANPLRPFTRPPRRPILAKYSETGFFFIAAYTISGFLRNRQVFHSSKVDFHIQLIDNNKCRQQPRGSKVRKAIMSPQSIQQYFEYEERMGLRRQAMRRFYGENDLNFPCPNCGSQTGTPVSFDFGVSTESGYHDAGEACSECMEVK